MNIHHLELFYHVARCAGVSAAARQMPYGIQQPAISAQILQLEDHLGKVLFRRRPFELTREGEILFEFIAPFFDGLPTVGERLRGGAENHLRIAAPGIVQRDYLPRLLAAVSERIDGFRFSLQSGRVSEIEGWLRSGEVDLGLATVAGPLGPDVQFRPLLSLRLELLVPESAGYQDSEEILACDRIDLPLITLPASQPPCRLFQEELQRRGIGWLPSLELANLELVTRYVVEGYGVGLSLRLPGSSWEEGVRALPLPEFPEVNFGALTIDRAPPLVERFADEAEKVAKEMTARS